MRCEPDPTKPPPIAGTHVLARRRREDMGIDRWSIFNVAQDNFLRGGLPVRTANGRRTRTSEGQGFDQGAKLNRAVDTCATDA